MKKIIQFFRLNTFPAIIALSALSVSASAAFYSVTGLSKLFAGASTEVLIMASSLEIAKLVIASLLYQYWGEINKLLRTYLTIAATILVFITSAGIYGFLSAAYQETATKSEILDKEVNVINLKKERFEENRNFYLEEKKAIDQSITDLRNGLSNNIVQYKDRETGQIITTQSSSNRKTLESQLNVALESRNGIAKKIENVTDSISSLDVLILEKQSNTELASELGPLKYLSGLTGIPMGNIVNWLMLVIIFVFDPLAISLVIAANFAFARLRNKKDDVSYPKNQVEPDNDDMKDNFEIENQEKYTPTPEELESFEKYLQKVEESKKIQEQRIRQELEKTKYIPTDEDIERLQLELDKLMDFKKNQSDIENLENEIKLSEEEGVQTENTTEQLEELNQEENAEPSTSQPIRRLIYQKRDGRNTRFDRI